MLILYLVLFTDFFCHIKGSPGFWPAGIKSGVCDNFSNFFLCYAMFFLHLRGEISKNYQGYRLPLGWLRLRCFGLWKKVCPLWTIPIQTIHHRLIQQIVQKK